ncbi:protein draper-like, partial [Temnothorax curvispinosus]|uniref:Protein draper-like n=1 Tax=Temnothorax curvispinosus TaxID=300111 RepID=A0A6J1QGT5_9HYME
NVTKQRPVRECCKGYTETTKGDRCIPVCSEGCLYGTCIAPDVCECESGYRGSLCDTKCPSGKWGRDCKMDCKCQNGATCDPFDGKCKCTRGWIGLYCDRKCSSNRYGQDCAEECRCQNGGSSGCDHITGECQCKPGFYGDECLKICPEGTFGLYCTNNCTCENNATCNPSNGTCVCGADWMGETCSQRACEDGLYGSNCTKVCE